MAYLSSPICWIVGQLDAVERHQFRHPDSTTCRRIRVHIAATVRPNANVAAALCIPPTASGLAMVPRLPVGAGLHPPTGAKLVAEVIGRYEVQQEIVEVGRRQVEDAEFEHRK